MEENLNRVPGPDDATHPLQSNSSFFRIAIWSLVALGLVGLLIALMLPVNRSREPGRRAQCVSQMKQIGLALQHYAKAHGALPPAYTTDADGKPLHSWRTLVLPYMGQQKLYESIDFTKPWDNPVNVEAFRTNVSTYQCPSLPFGGDRTTYLAVVTPGSCMHPAEPRPLSEITDGVAQTLVVIEVDGEHAVPWMSPVDADEDVVLGIGPPFQMSHAGGLFAALFVDGSVHFFNAELTAAQRRALISIAGGDQALAKAALDDMD